MAKYDFPGIKKMGASGLMVALSSTPWGQVLVTQWGLRHVVELLLEWFANWAANKGLVLLNVAAVYAEGEFDQKAFDKAIEDGLAQIEKKEGKLSPSEIKAIDDKVIRAARKFLKFNR